MKLTKWIVFLLLGMFILVQCSLDETAAPVQNQESSIKLFINEFMASNDAGVVDPDDDGSGDGTPYDDWIEIYNAGIEAANIGGMYITDDLEDLTVWQIPTTDEAATTIEPCGFLILWADKETDQGILHTDIKLSGDGEDIALVESDGLTIIDSYTYEAMQADVSKGRLPDGGDTWEFFSETTPGASNSNASTNVQPVISDIAISPDVITDSTIVIISARATDANDNLESFTITYGEEGAMNSTKNMLASVTSYEAEIGPFTDQTIIYFYLTATDDSSVAATSETMYFVVGDVYIPPELFINEFMASNDTYFVDPDDTTDDPYDDWIEIFNQGAEPVDIGGMYVTDDLTDLTIWQIPDSEPGTTTIPAGGFLVLWADKETEQGVLHINLKLSGGGEDIGLIGPNGSTIIDSFTYTDQLADTSYGRYPDASDNWQFFSNPTPGQPNQP